MSEQPIDQAGPPDEPGPDDFHSRDMGTLAADGPQLTQFETPNARGPGPGGGQEEAVTERPRYSPVAQPGMIERIHWHTVESREGGHEPQRPERRRRGRWRRRGGRVTVWERGGRPPRRHKNGGGGGSDASS